MYFRATHSGVVRIDARNRHAVARIPLRETKLFYVSKYGTKFHKSNGEEVVRHVNRATLLVDTIRGIGDERVCAVDGSAAPDRA